MERLIRPRCPASRRSWSCLAFHGPPLRDYHTCGAYAQRCGDREVNMKRLSGPGSSNVVVEGGCELTDAAYRYVTSCF
jgi:hypothetical protein